MKRIGHFPQGKPRLTCLADKIHQFVRLDMPSETMRLIIKSHYENDWSGPYTAEEMNEIERALLEALISKGKDSIL